MGDSHISCINTTNAHKIVKMKLFLASLATIASVNALPLELGVCSIGPGYWCQSAANQAQCDGESFCQYLIKQSTNNYMAADGHAEKNQALDGDKNCQLGPIYWCANGSNAQECNQVTFCFWAHANNFEYTNFAK